LSRPSPGVSYPKEPGSLHYEDHTRNPTDPTISVTPVGGLPHLDSITGLPERSPQLTQLPPPAQPAQHSLPAPPQQKLTLPTVASLLNSPPQETTRPMDRRPSWQEPLAPTPLVPALSNLSPLAMPDIDADLRRIKSPSDLSDLSRSQSRGAEMYRSDLGRQSSYGSQPSIQTGPLREDHTGYYREESRSESLPPHTRFPPQQQNVLPPVRLPDQTLSQRSSYFPPSRYDSMAPPTGISQDPNYARETYSRSPAQHRSIQSPLPPPALPPHTIPSNDTGGSYFSPREPERRLVEPPRDPRDPRDPRFPPFREDPPYYERDNREYHRYEDQARYMRDRIFERERIDMHHIENERQRERDRLTARDMQREREGWARERGYTENYPPRQYGGLPPRSRSPVFPGRDYEREEWERAERERMARWPRR